MFEQKQIIKLRAGNVIVATEIWREGGSVFFKYPFCRALGDELKARGATWHGYKEPPRKLWSLPLNSHTLFQLDYMQGKNPYAPYETKLDASMIPLTRYHKGKQKDIALLSHQPEMTAHILQRRGCILAAEMGTSKTLSDIIAMEFASLNFQRCYGKPPTIWYVAPRSALRAVQREFIIWDAKVNVEFMTYEGLVKKMQNWTAGNTAPYYVTYDESSKGKNFTTARAQAMFALAEAIRKEWPRSNPDGGGYVILMSGSPSPKSPIDWWSQAEIACPGYLKEGDIYKFKNRLAIIVKKEGDIPGGSYPELVTWKDDANKCNVCGQFADAAVHGSTGLEAVMDTGNFDSHEFVPSINEVAFLKERLSGLVLVKFKKDCMDLPDKTYRTIELKPSASMQRAANMLLRSSPTVIEGLTRVRELSDGFQYNQVEDGEQPCPACLSTPGLMRQWITGPDGTAADGGMVCCPNCGGTSKVKKFKRETTRIKCPKDDVLKELLDEYEDVGRVVIYAGFTGSIDRCVDLCTKEGWCVIRVDSRGDIVMDASGRKLDEKDYLLMFQDKLIEFPRVAFVAHPGSGGMGLTLTASPIIIYYSNDFNAENRIQSEDRIHRSGMDLNRGATICDIVHLHTDQKILDNLQKKRDLQSLTLGEFTTEDSHATDAI